MGGIVGIFNLENVQVPEVVDKMCNVIRHRGPHGRAYFFDDYVGLGVVNLNINDEEFNQPIFNEDQNITLLYDGEIYNAFKLKNLLMQKGHKFLAKNEFECLIHLYEEHGVKYFDQINGMFAFSLYDKRQRRLLLVRDKVGIKPLYYSVVKRGGRGEGIVFASEIKAILKTSLIKPEMDYRSIADYLYFGSIIGSKTMFNGVKRLQPGQALVATPDGFRVLKYWDLPPSIKWRYEDEVFIVKRFREKILKAIKSRLSGVIGSTLSGGMDSSVNVLFASSMTPLKAFTVAFPGMSEKYDESKYALDVAKLSGVEHYVIYPTLEEVIDAIKKLPWFVEEPTGSGAIATCILAKHASRYVKVLLFGEGGDELFGGYETFLPAYMEQRLVKFVKVMRNEKITRLVEDLIKLFKVLGLKAVISTVLRSLTPRGLQLRWRRRKEETFRKKIFCRNTLSKIHEYSCAYTLERLESKISDPFWRRTYLFFKIFLPSFLTVDEQTTIAHSMESRYPYLDDEVVNFALMIPPSLKLRGLVTKYVPRKAMKTLLPSRLLIRRKTGFRTPINHLLRTGLKELIFQVLMDSRTLNRGLFNKDAIKELVEKHLSGEGNYGELLWRMINVELWCRTFLDEEI